METIMRKSKKNHYVQQLNKIENKIEQEEDHVQKKERRSLNVFDNWVMVVANNRKRRELMSLITRTEESCCHKY